jgi:hypothetical protein
VTFLIADRCNTTSKTSVSVDANTPTHRFYSFQSWHLSTATAFTFTFSQTMTLSLPRYISARARLQTLRTSAVDQSSLINLLQYLRNYRGRLILHWYCMLAIMGITCSLDTRLEDCARTSEVHRRRTGRFVGARDEAHTRYAVDQAPCQGQGRRLPRA